MASMEVIVSIIFAPISRRSPPMIFLITMSSRRARSAVLFVGSTNKWIIQVNKEGMALRSFTANVLYSLWESSASAISVVLFSSSFFSSSLFCSSGGFARVRFMFLNMLMRLV